MGKLTISMAIFNSFLYVYQRLTHHKLTMALLVGSCPCGQSAALAHGHWGVAVGREEADRSAWTRHPRHPQGSGRKCVYIAV